MRFTITHPMHSHPYNRELVSGDAIAKVAAATEAAGIHGFGFTDHPAPSQRWLEAGGHDALDPFVALGFAAATTSTLRLIPNIVVLPYRNPFVVAKSGATLDLLSGGRFTLAVGVGYLKREFAALGVSYDERAELFEEALQVIRAVWTGDDISFEGRHFSARGITAHPRPVSSPHPPIQIGGCGLLNGRGCAVMPRALKCLPSNEMSSPVHTARITCTASSNSSARSPSLTPRAANPRLR